MLALTGCDRLFGIGAVQVTDASDKRDAALVDGNAPLDAWRCAGAGFLRGMCVDESMLSPLDLSSDTTFDTGGAGLCSPLFTQQCVLLGTTVTVSAHLRAIGSKPLVLYGVDSVVVTASGVVDVSSDPIATGAAADDSACTFMVGSMQTTQGVAAGGGPGGSFGGRGGSGGKGDANVNASAQPATSPTTLRGGCRGSTGGLDRDSAGAGAGGHGGGAVYLLSVGPIDIAGEVLAFGQGGRGGGVAASNPSDFAGGGGGGSGGMIVVDAASIVFMSTAVLDAAGGGGGGGENGTALGGAGGESNPMVAHGRAASGGALSHAGLGGSGGADATDGSAGGDGGATASLTQGGGGGGGGGAGVVRLFPPTTSVGAASVVPLPS